MGEGRVPVDLRNPGQVFACLGLMEAAEILCGQCEAGYTYVDSETQADFCLRTEVSGDPVATVLQFLGRAKATAITPSVERLSTKKWDVETIEQSEVFPCPEPDSPAALPILLSDGRSSVPIDHWADDPTVTGRDNVKFWAGAGGYPGAALARDALQIIQDLGGNALGAAVGDPFAVSAPQSSSFRFDLRRDYIPLDSGFSPNVQPTTEMVGYPLVELLAAIGLQNARPDRPSARDKLAYRYGVSSAVLPTAFVRAVLGTQSIGFPIRVFRMRLGWPGQEGQARCIIDAQEEFAP